MLYDRLSEKEQDRFCFSAKQPYWTLFTATFCHGSLSHAVNNMLMLCAFGPTLEAAIGPLAFTSCYLATGAGGWIARLLWEVLQYGELGLWTLSLGSSPATYGMAFLAAVAVPRTRLSMQVSPSIYWLTLLVLPEIMSRRRRANTTKGLVMQGLGLALGLPLASSLLSYWIPDVIYPLMWLHLYLQKLCLMRSYDVLVLKRRFCGTDHASHLGGSILGVALGYYFGRNVVFDSPLVSSLLPSFSYLSFRLIYNI